MRRKAKGKSTYSIVDLFAGPGGLGEGFTSMTCPSCDSKYAFRTAISIEKEEHAHATLKLRHFFRAFKPGYVPSEYYGYLAGKVSRDDLCKAYPKEAVFAKNSAWKFALGQKQNREVFSKISSKIPKHKKWVLVGGPPCQAYSLVGRARMKNMPNFESDPRHFLYREYLKIIKYHQPPVFVMENVKGLLSAKIKDKYVISLMLRDLRSPGKKTGVNYKLYSLTERGLKGEDSDPSSFVVRAEQYGIPQARHRIFIVGVRNDINIEPSILDKSKASTVKEIIGDMPPLRSGLSRSEDSYSAWKAALATMLKQPWFLKGKTNGLARFIEQAEKTFHKLDKKEMKKSSTKYSVSSSMENWFCDDRLQIQSSHESRSHMNSDVRRYFFAALYSSVNGTSPKLADFPSRLLPKHRNVNLGKKGKMFSDRFRVQLPDAPSTTITSHISKDGHYFIHYDPLQCRSLTVREAARLQTFPDNYKFEGPRTSQYQQVGNAVPPLLANKIAKLIYEILEGMK